NWAGQDWNTSVGVPTGWFYWLPPSGGNDGILSDGFENTRITNEQAHSGNYSLKFDPAGTHDGFVGTLKFPLDADVMPGDVVRISVWVKGENLFPDSVTAVGDQWSVAITPILHNTIGNNSGFGDFWASDIPLKFPNTTSFDWTKYHVDVKILDGTQSLSVRMHPLGRFQGTVYFDDLTVEKLELANLNAIGGFEQNLPSYWTKGSEPSGSTLTWATDDSRSLGRSLKIEKTSTGEAAMWESENMVDLWSQRHYANVDIMLGAYVKTMNVNTNPATDAEKWWISYSFYDSAGVLIGETQLPIDQSTATSAGWVADTTAVGETILPEDSWKTIIKFVAGANATGTVWADDFIFTGRGNWAGQDWNTSVGVPTGWFYWLPPSGGNDGILSDGFENTRITDEEAYTGNYSLKFDPAGTHDGFVGTVKFPINQVPGATDGSVKSNDISNLNNINVGDTLRISVWVKGANLFPDSVTAVGDQWSVAITPILHNTIGNNSGFGDFWASDIPLVFPNATSFDWTQFHVDVVVLDGTQSISVRIHPLGRFQGTVYFDDLEVKKLTTITDVNDQKTLPVSYSLSQNYPNPFNPTTAISFALPKSSYVTLKIYDMLGREVKTLINSERNAGSNSVIWNGDNNSGVKVSSGTYIYMIKAGEFTQAKKMILMK
ncbi:MAG: FlgD immunoglobulin-like domain containing protein, partial [Ignavibacteriaceae bacterium]